MKKIILFLLVLITFECFSQETDVVVIGQQKWMKKNLEVTKFRNGEVIFQAKNAAEWKKANLNKQAAWCYYKFDPLNGKKYGKLYNWFAVNDARGLAPLGWHVPSNKDWNFLIDYVNKNSSIKNLKSKSGWGSFKELGREEVEYCSSCDGMGKVPDDDGRYGTCWNCYGKGRVLKTISDQIKSGNGNDIYGFGALPGGYATPEGFFENLGISGRWWTMKSNYHLGSYNFELTHDEKYRSNTFPSHNEYGMSIRLIMGEPNEINEVLKDEINIGGQVWMSKNLEVDKFRNGDKIFYAKTIEEWKNANKNKQPAYCYYDNNPLNGSLYGKLYNYYAIIDPRGLPPSDWRIPNENDFFILKDKIKSNIFVDESRLIYKSRDSVAIKLKSKYWWNYGDNGNDEIGFAAFPGGELCIMDESERNRGTFYLRSSNKFFANKGTIGYWWLKSNNNDGNIKCLKIGDHYWVIENTKVEKQNGFSVRCIKDK